MYIYSCEHNWDSILTCIYEAWTSKRGHENIKLVFEPIEQYTLLDEYISVKADYDKAAKVMKAIKEKISPYVYSELAFTAMAYEDDVMDIIYRVLLVGFSLKGTAAKDVLYMVQYREIQRYRDIRCRIGKEVNRFQEIVRFHEIRQGNNSLYVAHIEPKSRLVLALGPIFADRMPSEHFIIVDDIYHEAVIHPKDEDYYLKELDDFEYGRLLETEEENDEYTDLWKVFFETIAIKERENYKCQQNLFPIWARKHAVEFK